MRNGKLTAAALLIALAFGISGGCNNGGGDGGIGEPPPVKPPLNLETAIDLGELSLVAYNQLQECIDSGKDAITVPSPWTLQEVIYSSADTSLNSTCKDDIGVVPVAFIATKGSGIYLAFRGTSNVSDALSDALALQTDYFYIDNGGRVSQGFLDAYEGTGDNPVEQDILAVLDNLVMTGDYDTLYITGHSLGGALAALAFPDLSQKVSIPNVFMYSFAAPAAGDADFVSAYLAEYDTNHFSWRVVNENDLVPKLPPQGLDCPDFMYEHVNAGILNISFGVTLPALPDFSADKCNLISIGADVLTYGLNNQDGIIENHKLCTYFMTLCEESNSTTCAERAIGCGTAESP